MSAVVAVHGLTKTYKDVTALDAVSFDVQENTIYGLLGRNGAGKTTLMEILTGQNFASAGSVEVFGEHPLENDGVLARVCFVKESQAYPNDFSVGMVLRAAALAHPNWDEPFARSLLTAFDLPAKRRIKKLSRGMRSAVGVVIGLASRAPLTLFDEPYVGLDAVARQLFYDRLLADYAEHPRTIVLSTHLIDEVSDLIERVVMLDRGRICLDEEADALRDRAVTLSGPALAVEEITAGRERVHEERMGLFARVTVIGALSGADRERAEALGVTLEPVSLQQLMIHTSAAARHAVPEGVR